MLLQKLKRKYSSFENKKINDFYNRTPKEELRKILELKRSEVINKNRINIPGRRSKMMLGLCKFF